MAKAFCILVEVVDNDIDCWVYSSYEEAYENLINKLHKAKEGLHPSEYEEEYSYNDGTAWFNDKKHGYHYDWQIFIREI
jgi:hypothetical protein